MALSLMRDVLLIAARVVTAGHLVGAWSGVIRPAHPHAGFAIGQQRLPIPFPLNPILLSQDMQEHGNRHRYPPNGGQAITRCRTLSAADRDLLTLGDPGSCAATRRPAAARCTIGPSSR